MTQPKILFVDDDPRILNAIERQFDDRYDLTIANGPVEGLKAIREDGPFALVVTDMRMPEMTGIEMLNEIKEISPNTIRIMLSGFADLETTIESINRGDIFRFLSKPCPNEILDIALQHGIRQHNIVCAKDELLEGTLMTSLRSVFDVLELIDPETFGRCVRVMRVATDIGRQLKLDNLWEVELATLYTVLGTEAIGKLTCELKKRYGKPEEDDSQTLNCTSKLANEMLSTIPKLENVGELSVLQNIDQDNVKYSCSQPTKQVVEIVRVAVDFVCKELASRNPDDAIDSLTSSPERYDATVVAALKSIIDIQSTRCTELPFSELRVGMVLARNATDNQGKVLAAKGHKITSFSLFYLAEFANRNEFDLPFVVSTLEQPVAVG